MTIVNAQTATVKFAQAIKHTITARKYIHKRKKQYCSFSVAGTLQFTAELQYFSLQSSWGRPMNDLNTGKYRNTI